MRAHLRRQALLTGLFLALLAAGLVSRPSRTAEARTATDPARCRVGAFITSLSDFNPAGGSFNADLWLWSLCADPERKPLETMEFLNASRVSSGLDSVLFKERLYWAQRKVSGTFRHDWDLRNFPFDRHTLTISVEEAVEDTSGFLYEPDLQNTAYNAQINLYGWEITSFRLVENPAVYNTTYGDPALQSGSSEYTGLRLEIGIQRREYTTFFNLTAAIYVSIAIMLVTFFLHLDVAGTLGPRMSLLAGSLFVVVVNMRTASTSLGQEHGMTLVGQIHIVALIYIMAATMLAVISRQRLDTQQAAVVRRFNYRCFVALASSYVLLNLALVLLAAQAG
jgi:hypothetical protein